MAREYCHFIPDGHAIFIKVSLRCTGEHDAGAVITVKYQRPFNPALGENNAPCPNTVQLFTRRTGVYIRHVIREAFRQSHEVIMPITNRCRTRHDCDILGLCERLERFRYPIYRLHAVYFNIWRGEQTPAKLGLFINEDNAAFFFRSCQSRRNTRRPCADNQCLAMPVRTGIIIRILSCWCRSKARHIPDKGFIDLIPKGPRPHEGFIIKTCGKEHREGIVESANIKF